VFLDDGRKYSRAAEYLTRESKFRKAGDIPIAQKIFVANIYIYIYTHTHTHTHRAQVKRKVIFNKFSLEECRPSHSPGFFLHWRFFLFFFPNRPRFDLATSRVVPSPSDSPAREIPQRARARIKFHDPSKFHRKRRAITRLEGTSPSSPPPHA